MASAGTMFIAPKVQSCLGLFHDLIHASEDCKVTIIDQLGRFNIWAGNIGAFQELPLPSSLDYRLREAPKVVRQVGELLDDLEETLHDVMSILSGERPNRTDYESEPVAGLEIPTSDETDDPSLGSEELEPQSELEELLKSSDETLTSLFKISVLIRNATTRDRYAKAAASASDPFNAHFDISHVGQKFPRIHRTLWLEKRLGKAISQRRQYLRYCRDHREKTGAERKSNTLRDDAAERPDRQVAQLKLVDRSVQFETSRLGSTKTPSTLPITTASTLNVAALEKEDDHSDDVKSQTSYATSVAEGPGHDLLRVPPLPSETIRGLPFECSTCWTVQTLRSRPAWKRHVFRDLKPYVCLFEECDLKMFAERSTWFNHELQEHRVEWHCPLCSHSPFQTRVSFQIHIRECHAQKFAEEHLPALAEACRQSIDKFFPKDCPFCDEWSTKLESANPSISVDFLVVTAAQFQQHVGAHMEQLALFALPRDHSGHEASTGAAAGPDDHPEFDLGSCTSYEEQGNPPLHVAAYEGLEAEVLELLRDGADFSADGPTWGNVVAAAIEGGQNSVLRLLLDRVDLPRLAHSGFFNRERERAGRLENEEAVKMLEEARDNHHSSDHLHHRDRVHRSSSSNSSENSSTGRGEEISGIWVDRYGRTLLARACASDDVSEVQRCLEQRPEALDIRDHTGNTPLQIAALNGSTQIVRYLLKFKPLLDTLNVNGDTSLIDAVKNGHVEIVGALLREGANSTIRNSKGLEPIDLIPKEDEDAGAMREILQALRPRFISDQTNKASLANVDLPADGYLSNDIKESCLQGDVERVEKLLRHDPLSLRKQNKEKNTLLHLAVFARKPAMVRFLLSRGCDLAASNSNGSTPLHAAVRTNGQDILQILLSHAEVWNINLVDADLEDTPLHLAAKRGHLKMAELLLHHGANLNSKNCFQQAPLHCAVNTTHKKIVKLLCTKGCDINSRDEDGNTPLHCAVRSESSAIAKMLLEAGCDMNAQNSCGDTAHDLAIVQDYEELMTLLRQAGANSTNSNNYYVCKDTLRDLKINTEILLAKNNLVEVFLEHLPASWDPILVAECSKLSIPIQILRKAEFAVSIWHPTLLMHLFHNEIDHGKFCRCWSRCLENHGAVLDSLWQLLKGYDERHVDSKRAQMLLGIFLDRRAQLWDLSGAFGLLVQVVELKHYDGIPKVEALLSGFDSTSQSTTTTDPQPEHKTGSPMQGLRAVEVSSARNAASTDEATIHTSSMSSIESVLQLDQEESKASDPGADEASESSMSAENTAIILISLLKSSEMMVPRFQDVKGKMINKARRAYDASAASLDPLISQITGIATIWSSIPQLIKNYAANHPIHDGRLFRCLKRSEDIGERILKRLEQDVIPDSLTETSDLSAAPVLPSIDKFQVHKRSVKNHHDTMLLIKEALKADTAETQDALLERCKLLLADFEYTAHLIQNTSKFDEEPRLAEQPSGHWVYLDLRRQVQGPFTGRLMHKWYEGGFLSNGLQVKTLEDTEYQPLSDLIGEFEDSWAVFLGSEPEDMYSSASQSQVEPPPGLGGLPLLGVDRHDTLRKALLATQADATRSHHSSEPPESVLEENSRGRLTISPAPNLKAKPIQFRDAIGRRFNFPFHLCETWTVSIMRPSDHLDN